MLLDDGRRVDGRVATVPPCGDSDRARHGVDAVKRRQREGEMVLRGCQEGRRCAGRHGRGGAPATFYWRRRWFLVAGGHARRDTAATERVREMLSRWLGFAIVFARMMGGRWCKS